MCKYKSKSVSILVKKNILLKNNWQEGLFIKLFNIINKFINGDFLLIEYFNVFFLLWYVHKLGMFGIVWETTQKCKSLSSLFYALFLKNILP